MIVELESEYRTYLRLKDELLSKHEGAFVLMKGSEMVDIFSSYEDALKAGLKKFGNVPFLVKQIQREDEVNFFYTNVVV